MSKTNDVIKEALTASLTEVEREKSIVTADIEKLDKQLSERQDKLKALQEREDSLAEALKNHGKKK